jgi:Flp pilus assembly protein TadB
MGSEGKFSSPNKKEVFLLLLGVFRGVSKKKNEYPINLVDQKSTSPKKKLFVGLLALLLLLLLLLCLLLLQFFVFFFVFVILLLLCLHLVLN